MPVRRGRVGRFLSPLSLPPDRRAPWPWCSLSLAAATVATALATGAFVHPIGDAVAGQGSFGWPALVTGRWWTVVTSAFLSRDWFMASAMAVALVVGLGAYERRAGHARAIAVAAIGHVTSSVVVAVGAGALGYVGSPVLGRAAANLDYGGSDVVAAALGGLACWSGDRRIRRVVAAAPFVALLVHHQMADWGHLAAVPAGYAAARMTAPGHRWRAAGALAATAAVTAALTVGGSGAVEVAAAGVRFRAVPTAVDLDAVAPASPFADRGPAHGRLRALVYRASADAGRPARAIVYVPDSVPRRRLAVVVFLHPVPGVPSDWLAGGDLAHELDRRISSGALPPMVAVMPTLDDYRDPNAGWRDVPRQGALRSLSVDLLPALARRYRVDLSTGAVVVVGAGNGADGALAWARADRRVGVVAAISPDRSAAVPAGDAALVLRSPSARSHRLGTARRWAGWRIEERRALTWLGARWRAGAVTS